jgi:nucleoside 2-deoxyribosyltransferase
LERVDAFLLWLATKAKNANDICTLREIDWARAGTEGEEDLKGIVSLARGQGYLDPNVGSSSGGTLLRLSYAGWQHVTQIKRTRTQSNQCFVAMWFDHSMTPAYTDGIAVAIQAVGLTPKRIDQVEHSNKICDEIVLEIRRSALVVADFTFDKATGHRGGVYFEAGFAMGLQIPVIWTCHQDSIDHIHFDTRQYNHITWETPADLASRLEARIRATLPHLVKV